MLKGILGGGFWGVVVAGVSLGTASLVAEQPAGSAPPSAPSVDAPAGLGVTEGLRPQSDLPARVADAGGAPQPSDTPQVSVETATVRATVPDTTPPEAPDAAQSTAGLDAPEIAAAAPIAVAPDAPVLPNPQAAAPQVPAQEADVMLETTTPPLPDPEPEVVTVADPEDADPAPEVDGGTEAVIIEAPEALDPPTGIDPDIVIVAEGAPEPAPVAREEPAPTAPVGEATTGAPQNDIETDPRTETGTAEDGPDVGPEVRAGVVPPADEPQETIVLVDPDPPVLSESDGPDPTDGPRIALRGDAATLPGAGADIRVIRPGTGTEPEPEDPSGAQDTGEVSPVDPDAPALVRYAEPLDNPDGLPLVGVILIDDGVLAGATPAISGLPFEVTIAIDPTAPGAADRMAAYRAAGIEVMALARLPQGATPADAEVALEAAFRAVPEAVGLLDAGVAGLGDTREVVVQAMARLASDGRGFVTAAQGLNSALRAAEAASVPAGLIYRDLDAEDQTAQVIRRFLDQSAFRAGQQSGVILLGRVRADTLSALSLWGTANRAGQVMLAPISHVLRP